MTAHARSKSGSCKWRWARSPRPNLAKAIDGVREAAKRGAQLVVLPELFRSRYFCQTEDAKLFELAEAIPGPSTDALAKLAEELESHARREPVREARGRACTTTRRPCSTRSGGYLGKYRKMHIPDDPRYYEKFYFTPGDLGFKVVPHARGRARRARLLGPVVSRRPRGSRRCKARRSSSIRRRSAGTPRRRRSTASASTALGRRSSAATRSRTAASSSP